MKSLKYFLFTLMIIAVAACDQEVIELQQPEAITDTSCEDAVGKTGTADFTKLVAVGNSFVAGVQGGALFTDGQSNSLALIINKQLDCVRGNASTFNQPSIGASLGWNLFITQPFLADNTKPILGRMLLQYNGSASPKPTPQPYPAGVLEALPNPAANPGFMYSGSKTELNNFAVPAITLGQALTAATGGPAPPAPNPAFTPFYLRFASSPSPDGSSGSSITSDAKAAGGTFHLFWLGLDDFFLYAAFGGDPTKAPLTSSGAFTAQYNAALFTASPNTGLLTADADSKAVVGNFPDIFLMPHFTSVTYNAIPLDAVTAEALTTNLATNYNGFLNAMVGAGVITAEERDKRLLTYVAGQNKILLTDETLTDLTAAMNANGAGALVPYARARQTTSADKLPLSAGSVLGVNGAGVNSPLSDQYVLIPSEIIEINNARTSFNATVQATVDANPTRLALADVNGALSTLVTNQAGVYNGVTITPNINPPTGIYSEDGVHLNSRGYAFISRTFIAAINTKFGSEIPLTDLSKYSATGLPIP